MSGFGESSVAGRIAVSSCTGGELLAAAGQTNGAPVGDGLGQLGDDRKFIVFYDDASSASLACSDVSEQTSATICSPTKRTTSTAEPVSAGVAPGEPSGRWNIGLSGGGLTPRGGEFAPV